MNYKEIEGTFVVVKNNEIMYITDCYSAAHRANSNRTRHPENRYYYFRLCGQILTDIEYQKVYGFVVKNSETVVLYDKPYDIRDFVYANIDNLRL